MSVSDIVEPVVPTETVRTTETHTVTSDDVYPLDKAPIQEVNQLLATVNGIEVLLEEGTDFSLVSFSENNIEQFTFTPSKTLYTLKLEPDQTEPIVLTDDNTTYTNGTDYEIIDVSDDTDSVEQTILWLPGGGNPTGGTKFTVEYTSTYKNSAIDFSIGGKEPDTNTDFIVTYTTQSVVSRYIEAHQEEFDDIDASITDVVEGKYVDTASGRELDEIGKLFGQIGLRRGRDDDDYRKYLKSIVGSFSGRGTLDGMRFAISSGLGIGENELTIDEDFPNTSYRIILHNWPNINSDIASELAELSDPSGVGLKAILYDVATFEIFAKWGSSNTTQTIGFGGCDFNSGSTFGSNCNTNTFSTQTVSPTLIDVLYTDTSNRTELSGNFGIFGPGGGTFGTNFGESFGSEETASFGESSFGSSTDDSFSSTAIDGYHIEVNTDDVVASTATADGFGADSFDGGGTLGDGSSSGFGTSFGTSFGN